MKIAVSNLALPPCDHLSLLPHLAAMGAAGIEIAPANTWPMPVSEVGAGEVQATRRAAEAAGLAVVGLHALLDGMPELGLFKDQAARERTLDAVEHLSALCRDLGGRTLVWGGRWRGALTEPAAWTECRAFLEDLLPRIEEHGTLLCFQPLNPGDGDFCATAAHCRTLVLALDEHPSLGLHLGAAALPANRETGHLPFARTAGRLEHFHADEPGLAPLGSTGQIDHADLRRHLQAIGYRHWVSVVQRPVAAADPLAALDRGIRLAIESYWPAPPREDRPVR